MLHNTKIREELEVLPMKDVYKNANFRKLRTICDQFQKNLDCIFLNNKEALNTLTLKYGIF